MKEKDGEGKSNEELAVMTWMYPIALTFICAVMAMGVGKSLMYEMHG